MTCDQAVDALHQGDHAPGLAEHLASCADCRALAADLARLELAAAELPREIQPARDL